jgi:hypothetical protein
MSCPVTCVNDNVVFEVESIDRMYLNVWQPRLQHGPGAAAFFTVRVEAAGRSACA